MSTGFQWNNTLRWKLLRRLAAFGALLVTAALLAGIVVLMLPATQRYIREAIDTEVAGRLDAEVRIGAITVRLPAGLELRDVRIVARPPETDSVVADVVRLSIAPLLLVVRALRLTSVEVVGCTASLTRDSTGVLVLARSLAKGGAGSSPPSHPWTVSVNRVVVRDLQLCWRDRVTGVMVQTDSGARVEVRDMAEPHVDLRVTNTKVQSPWWTGTVDEAAGRGTIDKHAVTIRQALVRAGDVRIESSAIVPLDATAQWRLVGTIGAGTGMVRGLYSALAPLDSTGHFVAEVRVDGPRGHPACAIGVRGHAIGWAGMSVDSLSADWHSDTLGNVRLACRASDGLARSLNAQILARLDSMWTSPRLGAYAVDCRATGVNLRAFAATMGVGRPTGLQADARLLLRGTGASARPREAKLAGVLVTEGGDSTQASGPLSFDLALGGDSLVVRAARGPARLDAIGTWATGDSGMLHCTATLDPALLAPFLDGEVVTGAVHAEVNGRWLTSPRLDLRAELTGAGLSWRGLGADSASCILHVDSSGTEIVSSQVAVRGPLAAATRRLGLGEVCGEADVALSASGPIRRLNATARFAAAQVQVAGIGPARVTGSAAWMGGDTLRWVDVTINDSTLQLESSGTLQLSPKAVVRATLAVSSKDMGGGPAARIEVHGCFDPDSLDVEVETERASLSPIHRWLPSVPLQSGRLSGVLVCRGRLDAPEADLRFALDSLSLPGTSQVCGTGSGRLLRGSLRGSFWGGTCGGSDSIVCQVDLPLSVGGRPWHAALGEAAGKISVALAGVDCALFNPWFAPRLAATGDLSLQVVLSIKARHWLVSGEGSLARGSLTYLPDSLRLDSLRGTFRLSDGLPRPSVAFSCASGVLRRLPADRILASAELNGTLDSAHLTLTATTLRGAAGGELTLSGSLPIGKGRSEAEEQGTLAYRLSSFPVVVFAPLLPAIHLQGGHADGSGSVSVRDHRIVVLGDLQLAEGTVALEGLKPTIGPVSATVRFTADSLVVDQLDGRWGKKGRFGGNGTMPWRKGVTRFSVHGTSLPVVWERSLDATIDSLTLALAGARDGMTVDGRVRLGRGTYRQEVSMADLPKWVRSSRVVLAQHAPDSLLRRVRVDIGVVTGQPFGIDLGLARVHSDVDVRVSGQLSDPRYRGIATLTDGTIRYLDRTFTVVSGSFGQAEPVALNPALDLEATTSLAPSAGLKAATRYTVTLHVGGTLDEPVVSFTADPELSMVDIMSLLTLGRVRNSDEAALALDNPSGFATVVADRARVLATQELAGLATRRIERLLRLDEVTIDGDMFSASPTNGARLTVSKQIFNRLTLSYQSVIGNTDAQRIKASYKLTHWLFLEGETNGSDDASLDLRTRWSR